MRPSRGVVFERLDRVRARCFRLSSDFGLLPRFCKCAYTECRLDHHLYCIANTDVRSLAQVLLDDDEEAVPAFSNIAVECDAVHAADNNPTMTATSQTHRLEGPLLLRIKRNQHNRDALVALDQLGLELYLICFPVFHMPECIPYRRRQVVSRQRVFVQHSAVGTAIGTQHGPYPSRCLIPSRSQAATSLDGA